ncbi:hypothetical protein PCL_05247 [Purpureocillium lilacinum]|uniref:Uncharacterized protein n=1 Tax=Purpureocillium lilacinum TaxID=33203 RepID=A0A2U3DVK0_PURLI|nr:hypothetical protein PCL_05247 [Purpureocillium lilacinum]
MSRDRGRRTNGDASKQAQKGAVHDRLPGPVGPDPRIAANCRRHRASTRARHRSRAQTLLDSACSRAPPDPLVRSRPAAAAAATRESVEVGLWAFSAMPRPAHRLPFASQLPIYTCWAGNGAAAAARGRGDEEAASLRRRRERKGAGETSLGHATRRPGKACPPARPQNALPATTHTPSPLVIRRASPGVVDGGAVCGMRECCCWRRKRRRDGEGDPSLSAVRVMKLLSSPVHIRRRGALPPPPPHCPAHPFHWHTHPKLLFLLLLRLGITNPSVLYQPSPPVIDCVPIQRPARRRSHHERAPEPKGRRALIHRHPPQETDDSQLTRTAPPNQSSGLMPAFESLQQQKNKQDAARRQSLSDQQAKGGVFSQLFHNNLGRNAK